MGKFVSLVANLEGFFDKALADLPSGKRALVERDFLLSGLWDQLDARRRQLAAEQLDYQRDPATEPERESLFRLLDEIGEIEREIDALELMRATTPTELRSRRRQLIVLREQLRAKQREMRKAEATAPVGHQVHGRPVSSTQIASAFRVDQEQHKNELWWEERMRNATRYGRLVECRAAPGRGKRKSLWYPALIAHWLVQKGRMKEKGAASVLRKHFPDCSEAADLFDPTEAG